MKIAVTGAFGYSGKYIAKRLLADGHEVFTLTNSPLRRGPLSPNRENPFGDAVRAVPFHFDQPERLAESLRGVDALINTYWVRFDHKFFNHREAVENTLVLFRAAKEAGVKRIVHTSITNPDIHSPLPYFSGKAELEEALRNLGISYAILRPTVLFGEEDVLINNIAWALRRLPIIGLFGRVDYRLQPIFVDDFAALAVKALAEPNDVIWNAIGPETFTYRELIEAVRDCLGLRRLVVPMPPQFAYLAMQTLGTFLGDVIITREEIRGLMENCLCVDTPPLGQTKLTDWMQAHRDTLGKHYANEIARRVDRKRKY